MIPQNARRVTGEMRYFYDTQRKTRLLCQQVGYLWKDEQGNECGQWDWEEMNSD